MPPLLSIVIPAHNEEARLPVSLSKVFAFLERQTYQAEVVIVENGSSDRTAQVVKAMVPDRPNLRLLREQARGKGLAVRRGMLEATGAYRFICDADLSMPIEERERFLPPQLTGYDIAIGSREVSGARRFDEPPLRHLMGRVFNRLVSALVVSGYRDTQCGFKCFRGPVAEQLFALQRTPGFGFDAEILFLARQRAHRVAEVPIDWYYRSESKVKPLRDTFVMLGEMAHIRWNWARGAYDALTAPPVADGQVVGEEKTDAVT